MTWTFPIQSFYWTSVSLNPFHHLCLFLGLPLALSWAYSFCDMTCMTQSLFAPPNTIPISLGHVRVRISLMDHLMCLICSPHVTICLLLVPTGTSSPKMASWAHISPLSSV